MPKVQGKKSSQFSGAWNSSKQKAKETLGESIPLEVGTYNLQVLSYEIGDFNNCRQVKITLVALDEEVYGQKCQVWFNIEDEERLVWLQRFMIICGIDIDSAVIESESDLEDTLAGLVETVLQCKVIEKNGYKNIKIVKSVSWEDELYTEKASKSSPQKSSKKRQIEDEEDEEDEDEEPPKHDSKDLAKKLKKYNRTQLKAYIIENALEIKVNRGMTDDDIIDEIINSQEA